MLYAAAYLRAAQAYILISMPTGTSTIFGAFQAILALLQVKSDELRPVDNVKRNEKLASGIFSPARGLWQCCNAQFFPSQPPVLRQINDASIGSSEYRLRCGDRLDRSGPSPINQL